MTSGSTYNIHWINRFRPYWPILKFRVNLRIHWPYFYGSGQLPNGSTRPIPIHKNRGSAPRPSPYPQILIPAPAPKHQSEEKRAPSPSSSGIGSLSVEEQPPPSVRSFYLPIPPPPAAPCSSLWLFPTKDGIGSSSNHFDFDVVWS